VVIPIPRGEDLFIILCLGAKRSGDVYTPVDLRLLSLVADKVSTQLLQFDQAEVIRQGRVMQEALRRYVPGAIVDQVMRGQELEVGEREVSILFVDIRGYTSITEDQRPEEIFSTVNRYTETVSDVIRQHNGSVVEFNGDGMMAVFGAPQELPEKERAAVEAAHGIVQAVGTIRPAGSDPDAQPLFVGVGIATGKAFVGNIRSVDRLIWTAVGNATNLASRLQTLTRELGASIVIDTRTRNAAGHVAADFERREHVQIRGRRRAEDVYIFPLGAR
jgi:adenylate cyclase